MTIHDRHDFQAFSALCRTDLRASALRHRKGRVDEALFLVQHATRAKLVGDVRQNPGAEPRCGTKPETCDAPFCNSDNTAAASAIGHLCSKSTTPLQELSASKLAYGQGVLPKYSLPENDAGCAPIPNRSAESSNIYSPSIMTGNTNETHAPGAYQRVFEKNVAAIFGYPNGPANLEGAATGDKVFAYVNQQGLRSIGTVLDPQVRAGTEIFVDDEGKQLPDEYHLRVEWLVVPADRAITSSDAATQFGYNLPVRSVFAKLHRGSIALRLENELRARAGT